MPNLSGSEYLLWSGVAVMAISVGMGLLAVTAFFFIGRNLNKRLEQEYGKPQS